MFHSQFTSASTYQLISVIIPTLSIHHSFTPSLFHSRLKTHLFNKPPHPLINSSLSSSPLSASITPSLLHSFTLGSKPTFSTNLLIHLSTHLCHHPHSRHPSLFHSFTLSLQAQNLPFQQILPTVSFTYRTAFMTTGLDRTYHAHHFVSSFYILIFCLFHVVDLD